MNILDNRNEPNQPNVKISQHAKDIIQKYTSALFKNSTLEFYGIKTAKIKELINVELPIVEVKDSSIDFIFLLEDNSYLHFEFQSSYNKSDIQRFANYDLRLYARDGRKIVTVIIYTSDVKNADVNLDIGSLSYSPSKIMMGDYDGDRIYSELDAKIKGGKELTDVDMLNLIFLPLMKNDMEKDELVIKSIGLAQTIEDKTKRDTCIASVFAFANRYLEESRINELLEVIKMTDLATLLVTDAVTEKEIEIARKALRKGLTVEVIQEITGLDEPTIWDIQENLDNE